MKRCCTCFFFMLMVFTMIPIANAGTLQVGVGRSDITPDYPIWMGGYASRKAPSEGKLHSLWAKALVIEDETEARSVVITLDLITVPVALSQEVARLVEEAHGIPRKSLLIGASHTHSSPALGDRLIEMYGMAEAEKQRVQDYSNGLPALLLAAVTEAMDDLEPVELAWGNGTADFAGNRRKYTQGGVTNSINPIGPVDHDVPVLRARRSDGSLKSVLFGYACHNTCTSFQQLSGDYAGFAQIYIEAQVPGCTALFVAGCGGDQNPLPRNTLVLAQLYGETLGRAVIKAMETSLAPVAGPLCTNFEEIPLKLSEAPTREAIEAELVGDNVYKQRRAKHLLSILDSEGALPTTYPYPVQVWKFTEGPQLTALGGEVTVDYSLRIKEEFGQDSNFVIAYANDVCAYIPSLRVLREGGYEGAEAMIYYFFHGPWAPPIEEDIMASVHRLAGRKPLINLNSSSSLNAHHPLRIAHRGGVMREDSPECSRRAIHLAADQGYTMVELDVQVSKDGEPILFHDKTMDKACGRPGAIADFNARELTGFALANGETIMHLEEALAICKTKNLGVMLDFKVSDNPDLLRRVLGLLQRFELVNATCCINGAPALRDALDEHIMFRLLDEQIEDGKADLKGYFWFGLPEQLDREQIKPMQERGALVIPGVNIFRYDAKTHVNDAERDIKALQAAGVDGFQIDSVYNDFIKD